MTSALTGSTTDRRSASRTMNVDTTMNAAVRGKSAQTRRHDVVDVGRPAADQHRDPRGRRERARRIAERVDQRPALVVVRPVRGVDRERGQVALRGRGEGGRHEAVRRAARRAVEQLVLRERQPRVDVHEAGDAGHPRVRLEPTRVVVELREVVGRRGVAGGPDREHERRELALAELPGEDVVRLARRHGRGRIDASGALNRTWRNGSPRTSSSVSVGTSTATGWRMTRRASRAHGPSAPGSTVTPRTARRSIRLADDREDRRQQRERRGHREAHDDRARRSRPSAGS